MVTATRPTASVLDLRAEVGSAGQKSRPRTIGTSSVATAWVDMAFVMSQQEIDRRTYEVTPHPLVLPAKCDKCGSTDVHRVVSREIIRGRMFVVGHRSPAFAPSASLAFCADCWPVWLMWRARMGFDLHLHRSNVPCCATCIARTGGRRAQLEAQMSLLQSPSDGFFFAQKSIDGLPRIHASSLIMAQRTGRFMDRFTQRQTYCESIGDATEVQRQFLRAWEHHALGVPYALVDRILIVVEASQSWRAAPGGNVALPRAGDDSIGLHSVLLTHYADHGAILGFVNSWGPRWGDRGYGTMPFEYLERYFYEAFVLRRARFGPPAWHFASTPDTKSPREFRRRLLLDAPRERIRQRLAKGESWVIEVYETPSPTTGWPVLCFDVQNGFGLRMGWAFLRHRPMADGGILEILELFVWPTFRRMGIGRMLEDIAVRQVAIWGCAEIHLMMNEADAVIGPPRAAARAFGQALGYEWRWRAESAPRRPATAIKRVVTPS